ncbi:MAG: signal transduction histidine kinase [Planctomycetota bacterium]|nr:signal transduction histidine kinase [Planctomycetota bacterium]
MTVLASNPATSANSRRHTILIVDDEPDVLDSLRHLFHRRYRVLTADTGSQGLDLLRHEDVHVILSDQRMPGMTGDQFLRRAREMKPDPIRLLFTGYAEIQTVIDAVNQGGIFRYIHKPWESGEIEAVVSQAAEQFELLTERKRLVTELQQANTKLLDANRELAETDQLKTAFLEVASHEFNTPITIVQGLSELLKLVNPDRDPGEREIVTQISESAGQLARLVSTMLKLLQAGDFRHPLRIAKTDLAGLLREVAAQAAPFVVARSLHFDLDMPESLGDFAIDPDKVRDAVVNLLTNAIKFTADGGQVRLSARNDGDGAVIEVADRGIGLEPRALAHLFEPFFTEFDTAQHSSGDFGFRKRGLGLGLSLVKKFIELHGGTVQAESAPGQGTRISLWLPRNAEN